MADQVLEGLGAFEPVPSPKFHSTEGGVGADPLEKVAGLLAQTVVGPLMMALPLLRATGCWIDWLQPRELETWRVML